jgi:hypothetical protein
MLGFSLLSLCWDFPYYLYVGIFLIISMLGFYFFHPEKNKIMDSHSLRRNRSDDNDNTAVILFSESNYQGRPVPIRGSKDVSWIEDIGFPNDTLASLIIADGYEVILYADSHFKGEMKTYYGPTQIPYIGDDFVKKTSSLKVLKKGSHLQSSGINWFLLIIVIILVIVIVWIILRQKGSLRLQ